MSFGGTLQKVRRAKRKTQREIADAIGMDYAYFSRIENDHFDYTPSRETVEKMVDALECTEQERHELLAAADRIDEEIERVAKLTNKRPELRELFRTAAGMPREEVQKLIDTARKSASMAKKKTAGDK
jgi:transcriptional regulator with XRE-family HTH domain